MNGEIVIILVRNVILSWLINTEFVAPLLFWIIAKKSRREHPALSAMITLPVLLLLAAGLVKQIYLQFFFPMVMLTERLEISEPGYQVYLILYTLLLVLGLLGMIKAIAYKRHISPVHPFGDQY